MISTYIWIAIFGSLGAISRFQLSIWFNGSEGFPFGTLIANILGCLLLGFCTSLSETYLDGPLKKGITAGFMGSLTTFSTFSMESIQLFEQSPTQGSIYFICQIGLGFLGAGLGYFLGKLC